MNTRFRSFKLPTLFEHKSRIITNHAVWTHISNHNPPRPNHHRPAHDYRRLFFWGSSTTLSFLMPQLHFLFLGFSRNRGNRKWFAVHSMRNPGQTAFMKENPLKVLDHRDPGGHHYRRRLARLPELSTNTTPHQSSVGKQSGRPNFVMR